MYSIVMSNLSIVVRNENQKPVFLIQKGGLTVGRFTARLSARGGKRSGSAFSAIIMRIITGLSVNVVGKMLVVDNDSIVGDNEVTEALRNLSNDPFFADGVPLNISNLLAIQSNAPFVDNFGARIQAIGAKNFQVVTTKYAQ